MTTQQKKLVEGTDIELYDQAKWSRATVADGKWLQNETLEPISSNDRILASAIHDTSANLTTYIDDSIDEVYENLSAISVDVYNKIDYISATVDNNAIAFQNLVEYVSGDLTTQIFNTSSFLQNEIDTSTQDLRNEISATSSYLQGEINTLEAATDVVDVIGTLNDLSNYDKRITSADIIKVLNASGPWTDPVTQSAYDFSGDQVYFRYTGKTSAHPNPEKWTYVGDLDPYYNKSEIDGKITTLSSTVSSNYLSANVTAVQSGHNIVISANPTEPKILIKTSDNVTFTGISATTLSATTAYGSSAKFDNISSTNLTALTAQGNSAKFTNISSTNLTALTAQGNQASYTNISATTLSGATTSINIDNLISAATAGAVSYSGKNGIQINDHDIMLSAKMSAIGNGITNSSAISLSSFKLSADTGIKFNATTDTLGISVSSSIINSAEAGASASAYITANSGKFLNSAHNAFSEVLVTFYKDPSGTQHNNTVFNANNSSAKFKFKLGDGLFGENDESNNTFIITTNNTAITADAMPKTRESAFIHTSASYTAAGNGITNPYTGYLSALYLSAGNGITFDTTNNKLGILVSSTLINSAKSGQYAYDIFSNSAKISAYGSNTSNSGIYDLSGGIKLSAGNNLTLIATGNNTIKIDAKDTGLTSISAGGNIDSPSSYNSTLTLSAGTGVKFIPSTNNVLGISAKGTTYNAGDFISTANDTISVKSADLASAFVPWTATNCGIGSANTATTNSFAQGKNNSAYSGSIAQGTGNSASKYSQAFGRDCIITNGGMAIGQANSASANVAFVIGNGTYDSNGNVTTRNDLFKIDNNGIIYPNGFDMYFTTGQAVYVLSGNAYMVSASKGGTSQSPSASATWYDLINNVGGNYVSASGSQSITLATATTALTPNDMVPGVIYLV